MGEQNLSAAVSGIRGGPFRGLSRGGISMQRVPTFQRNTTIQRPTFSRGGINTGQQDIRSRLTELDRIRDNPLASPGVGGIVSNLGARAARQARATNASLAGRLATSGQARFGGVGAALAQRNQQQINESLQGEVAGLQQGVFQQALAQGTTLTQALAAAEQAAEAQASQRGSILAQLETAQAQITSRERQSNLQSLLEQARLAEQARQFNTREGRLGQEFLSRLGFDRDQLGERTRQFDVTEGRLGRELSERTRQFDANLGFRGRELAENVRQFDTREGRLGREFDRRTSLDERRFQEDVRRFGIDEAFRRAQLGQRDAELARRFGLDQRRFDFESGLANRRFGEEQRQFDQQFSQSELRNTLDQLRFLFGTGLFSDPQFLQLIQGQLGVGPGGATRSAG